MQDFIAKALKNYRMQRNMTQADLSREADVSLRIINYIESGEQLNPKLVTLTKLARALGVSVEDLLRNARTSSSKKTNDDGI